MIIELIYELLGEISPMSFYLGLVLSIICSYRLMNVNMHHTITRNHDYTKECHAIHFKQLPKHEPLGEIREVHNWITHTTKRIDAPDDDTDNRSFSFKKTPTIRGGQQWERILYSLSSKNIALSGLF